MALTAMPGEGSGSRRAGWRNLAGMRSFRLRTKPVGPAPQLREASVVGLGSVAATAPASPARVTDPMCGMEVDPKTAVR